MWPLQLLAEATTKHHMKRRINRGLETETILLIVGISIVKWVFVFFGANFRFKPRKTPTRLQSFSIHWRLDRRLFVLQTRQSGAKRFRGGFALAEPIAQPFGLAAALTSRQQTTDDAELEATVVEEGRRPQIHAESARAQTRPTRSDNAERRRQK